MSTSSRTLRQYLHQRWVKDGKYLTTAGVSAGMDRRHLPRLPTRRRRRRQAHPTGHRVRTTAPLRAPSTGTRPRRIPPTDLAWAAARRARRPPPSRTGDPIRCPRSPIAKRADDSDTVVTNGRRRHVALREPRRDLGTSAWSLPMRTSPLGRGSRPGAPTRKDRRERRTGQAPSPTSRTAQPDERRVHGNAPAFTRAGLRRCLVTSPAALGGSAVGHTRRLRHQRHDRVPAHDDGDRHSDDIPGRHNDVPSVDDVRGAPDIRRADHCHRRDDRHRPSERRSPIGACRRVRHRERRPHARPLRRHRSGDRGVDRRVHRRRWRTGDRSRRPSPTTPACTPARFRHRYQPPALRHANVQNPSSRPARGASEASREPGPYDRRRPLLRRRRSRRLRLDVPRRSRRPAVRRRHPHHLARRELRRTRRRLRHGPSLPGHLRRLPPSGEQSRTPRHPRRLRRHRHHHLPRRTPHERGHRRRPFLPRARSGRGRPPQRRLGPRPTTLGVAVHQRRAWWPWPTPATTSNSTNRPP